MGQELIYTSSPRGVKAGSSGFCTVACTQGMSANLVEILESMSGYKAVYSVHDKNASFNPVSFSYIKRSVGAKQYSILSRVGFAGSDYSGRSNKIAHHVALEEGELIDAGPTWILQNRSDCFKSEWNEDPYMIRRLASFEDSPNSVRHAESWKSLTGDAGWAGVLAESFEKDPGRVVYVVFNPGMEMLPLLDESMSLLLPRQRWQISFNTYFVSLSPGTKCLWRCCLPDCPSLIKARSIGEALIIDLTKSLPKAQGGELVDAARSGLLKRKEASNIRIKKPMALNTEAGFENNEEDIQLEDRILKPVPGNSVSLKKKKTISAEKLGGGKNIEVEKARLHASRAKKANKAKVNRQKKIIISLAVLLVAMTAVIIALIFKTDILNSQKSQSQKTSKDEETSDVDSLESDTNTNIKRPNKMNQDKTGTEKGKKGNDTPESESKENSNKQKKPAENKSEKSSPVSEKATGKGTEKRDSGKKGNDTPKSESKESLKKQKKADENKSEKTSSAPEKTRKEVPKKKYLDLVEQGKKHLKQEKYKKAIQDFKKAKDTGYRDTEKADKFIKKAKKEAKEAKKAKEAERQNSEASKLYTSIDNELKNRKSNSQNKLKEMKQKLEECLSKNNLLNNSTKTKINKLLEKIEEAEKKEKIKTEEKKTKTVNYNNKNWFDAFFDHGKGKLKNKGDKFIIRLSDNNYKLKDTGDTSKKFTEKMKQKLAGKDVQKDDTKNPEVFKELGGKEYKLFAYKVTEKQDGPSTITNAERLDFLKISKKDKVIEIERLLAEIAENETIVAPTLSRNIGKITFARKTGGTEDEIEVEVLFQEVLFQYENGEICVWLKSMAVQVYENDQNKIEFKRKRVDEGCGNYIIKDAEGDLFKLIQKKVNESSDVNISGSEVQQNKSPYHYLYTFKIDFTAHIDKKLKRKLRIIIKQEKEEKIGYK